jgi:hypothetical protein
MAKILRDSETVNTLMKVFNKSRTTILRALDCKTNSDLAKSIRKKALDMGCQVKKSETIKYL